MQVTVASRDDACCLLERVQYGFQGTGWLCSEHDSPCVVQDPAQGDRDRWGIRQQPARLASHRFNLARTDLVGESCDKRGHVQPLPGHHVQARQASQASLAEPGQLGDLLGVPERA